MICTKLSALADAPHPEDALLCIHSYIVVYIATKTPHENDSVADSHRRLRFVCKDVTGTSTITAGRRMIDCSGLSIECGNDKATKP